MNTSITTNLRTHIVYIKDWSGEKELHITQDQYKIIREDIENLKANDFYSITDVDTKKTLFDWQRKDIIRFKEKNLDSNSWRKVICDYWNKHTLINWSMQCDCKKSYWYEAIELKLFAKAKYNIIYPLDITGDIRKEFYLFLKQNNDNIKRDMN